MKDEGGRRKDEGGRRKDEKGKTGWGASGSSILIPADAPDRMG
jgi:hypothetical protein